MSLIPPEYQSINLFVCCGGKSGSQTLYKTFKKNGFQTIHTHGNTQFQKVVLKSNAFTLYDLITYAMTHHPKIFIFDVYRTPIERAISSFFHNFYTHIPKEKARYTVESLITYFNKEKKYAVESYHPMTELFNHFEIPMPTTFDFDKEYSIVNYKNITFVKLRFSSLEKWGSILTELLGKPITIIPDNLSDKRWYYNFYKKFLNAYKPPKELLDSIQQEPHFKLYMSESEQEEYLKKWGERLL
jgi:hypothetical protein